MSASDIVPVHTQDDGATVLTFPANAEDFVCLETAVRYLKERGFSVGHWQEGSPAGIVYGASLDVDVRKWRDLGKVDQDALDGRMVGDGRHGPITVTIDSKASHAAHIDALLPQPAIRQPRQTDRGMTVALVGLFGCLALLGGMLFLLRPAPAVQRHAVVEQLFRAPKIGLRAEALGRVPAETEARR